MGVAKRDNCAIVLQRLAEGDRLRFFQDYHGVQYAELTPKWQFWRKMRVRLDAAEFARLKNQLKDVKRSA